MAFSGTTIAEASADLKEYYQGVRLNNLMLKANPFFGLIRKNSKVSGDTFPIPVVLSGSAGGGSSFDHAQRNQSAPGMQRFQVTPADEFQLTTINWKTALAGRNDAGAFMDSAKVHLDTAHQEIANRIARKILRRGTGSIGKISAIDTATGLITLVNPNDGQFYNKSVVLNASTTDGGVPHGGAASPVRAVVTKADWIKGTVTLDTEGGSADWIGDYAVGDFFTLDGSYGTPQMMGVLGIIPDVDHQPVAGESFWGVDRTLSPTQLAGGYYDGRGQSPAEAVISAIAQTSRFGGRPEILLVNPSLFGVFAKSLQSQREYIEVKGPSGIGYKAIEIMGEYGPVAMVSDRNVEPDYGHLLEMAGWELKSYEEAPHFETYEDGMIFYRKDSANAVEARLTAFGNPTCDMPSHNCTITFAATGV